MSLTDLEEIRRIRHEKYMTQLTNAKIAAIKPKYTNEKIAAIRLANKIHKTWFANKCINEEDLNAIPGIYRFRLNITTKHINKPSAFSIFDPFSSMSAEEMELQKAMLRSMVIDSDEDIILFRYGFDLRNIGGMTESDPISIEGQLYFFQPNDWSRIKRQWLLVNGANSASIRFLQNLEFDKAICKDKKI